MKVYNDSKIKMYQTVKALVDKHPARFFVVLAFEAAYLLFKGYLKEIEDQLAMAIAKKKEAAAEGLRRKEVLVLAANKVTKPVLAYANAVGNAELAAIMGITPSKLKQTMGDRMYAVCEEIHDEAEKVKAEAEAYGLAKEALPALKKANDSFKETEGASRLEKADVKAANQEITRLIPLADWQLTKQIEPFRGHALRFRRSLGQPLENGPQNRQPTDQTYLAHRHRDGRGQHPPPRCLGDRDQRNGEVPSHERKGGCLF